MVTFAIKDCQKRKIWKTRRGFQGGFAEETGADCAEQDKVKKARRKDGLLL